MDVKVAAKLAGMTVDEFVALNPAHNRSVINVNKLPTLLLPLDRMNQFAAGLRDLGDRALASIRIYTPRAGEPFEQIAKRHGVTVAALRRANEISPKARAAAGDIDLLIPSGAAAQYEEPVARAGSRAVARAAAQGQRRPAAAAPVAGNRQRTGPVAASLRQPGASSARKATEPRRTATAAPRKATPPNRPTRPTVVAAGKGAQR
jgi:membrane-bound lytic murein transglycosylase D